MSEQFQLETPEAVSVGYDIAGIGTRFLAAIVDSLAILGVTTLIILGAVLLSLLGDAGQTAGVVLASVLLFILWFGYFIVYETVWSGQTPGKRAFQIRVIKTSGYPISFVDALIRNLVRLIDALPSLYGVGIITMFINRQSRRLGDLAAGTIVVKERQDMGLGEVEPQEPAVLPSQPPPGELYVGELEWRVSELGDSDIAVIREFLDRAPSLPADVRVRIGGQMGTTIADRLVARVMTDPETFLRRVLFLREQRR